MAKPEIEILIPTYNRAASLTKNLQLLEREIVDHNLEKNITITISDNHSTDDTEEEITRFQQHTRLKINYHRNPENIGLEKNMVQITRLARKEFVLYLGDDDYLASGYLAFCLQTIESNPQCGLIIPGIANLFEDGTVTTGRNEPFETKDIAPSYQAVLQYSHLGHQLSGLVFRGRDFLDFYLQYPEYRNMYPFINWVGHQLLHHPAVYAPVFKTKVTLGNAKDWSYNQVGLLDEVYKAYYPFLEQFGEHKVADLMLRFTIMHAYRIDFNQGLWQNYKQIAATADKVKGFRRRLLLFLVKEYTKRKLSISF